MFLAYSVKRSLVALYMLTCGLKRRPGRNWLKNMSRRPSIISRKIRLPPDLSFSFTHSYNRCLLHTYYVSGSCCEWREHKWFRHCVHRVQDVMKEKVTNKYLKHIRLLLRLSANVAACSGKYHLCFPFHPLPWQGHSFKKLYPVSKLLHKSCTPERGGNHYLASHRLTVGSSTPVPPPSCGPPR